jgi:hypothetical protein
VIVSARISKWAGPSSCTASTHNSRIHICSIVEDVAPPAPVRPMLPPSKASRIAAWSANIKADGDDFSHDDDTVSRDSRDSGPLRSALKGGRARAGANPGDLDDVVEAFEPLTTNRAAKFYANWVSSCHSLADIRNSSTDCPVPAI